jgi:type II secretory pathway component PulK
MRRLMGARASGPALVALLLLPLVSCSPPTSEAEKAFREAQQREQERMEQFRKNMESGLEEEKAVVLVQDHRRDDESDMTERDWLHEELAKTKGAKLFGRWVANRRDSQRFEVRFMYTLIDEEGAFTKKGYAWDANLVLKLVGEPRELTLKELGIRRRDRSLAELRIERERKEYEFSLE